MCRSNEESTIETSAKLKSQLRAAYLQAMKAAPSDARLRASRAILMHICALPEIRDAKVIVMYQSLSTEVDTEDLSEDLRAAGKGILFVDRTPVRGQNSLPTGRSLSPVLVPGVAFTKSGARLGRGGGYFDRYLAVHRGPRIGLCFSWQLADELPMESHDVFMDVVVTEEGAFRHIRRSLYND